MNKPEKFFLHYFSTYLRTGFVFLGVFCSLQAYAQSSLTPGIYIRAGGTGILEIKKNNDGNLAFVLKSVGINGHTCSLDGVIQNNHAFLRGDNSTDADAKSCMVTFIDEGDGIGVKGMGHNSNLETGVCRSYCGFRAFFSGSYLAPKPGCSPDDVNHARDGFKYLFAAKNYKKARLKLEPLLNNCGMTLNPLEEEGPIRNDLAATYYQLGDFESCKAVLKPYLSDISLNDDQIEAYRYAPNDRENYLAIISAAREQIMLCSQPVKEQKKTKRSFTKKSPEVGKP